MNPAEEYREGLAQEIRFFDYINGPDNSENKELYDLLCEESERVNA